MTARVRLLPALIILPFLWTGATAQTPAAAPGKLADGAAVFDARCKTCHEPAVGRAPSKAELALRPKADVVQALTNGIMAPMAAGLSREEIDAVSAYVVGAPSAQPSAANPAKPTAEANDTAGIEKRLLAVPTGTVGAGDPMCASNPPLKATASDWSSMGVDPYSTRFQRHPGLTASDVPRLRVKWSFAMTGGGQPTVVGDYLFTTNRGGKLYALDAKTGCVHWATENVVSRTTPMVIRSSISLSGWATFVGQSNRVVKAFDAQTGKEIWASPQLEAHPSSVLTGTPIVDGDRLIVPISSIEEASSMSAGYVCCTFRGSVASLDLKTGKLLWKTSMVPEPAKVLGKNSFGKELRGPAGAAVWAAPSVDRKRGLVYVVTGDSYTDVETIGADAIVALDTKSGSIRWRTQVTTGDNFVMGCGPTSKSGNCPSPIGPDYDFGSPPILMTLKTGKQVVLAGQKSGAAYGLDPDTGKVLWKTAVGSGGALGGIEWGMGADDKHLFVPVSDISLISAEMRKAVAGQGIPGGDRPAKPGLYALDPATGRIVWAHPAPEAPCHYATDKAKPSTCIRAHSAAPGVMPGVVFAGALDGWFRAYDAATGKIIWEHSTTAETYDTVNGVKGQPGGGIDGMGPTIAGGMVYTMSGFNGAARVGSNGVNVLLAYSVDGK